MAKSKRRLKKTKRTASKRGRAAKTKKVSRTGKTKKVKAGYSPRPAGSSLKIQFAVISPSPSHEPETASP